MPRPDLRNRRTGWSRSMLLLGLVVGHGPLVGQGDGDGPGVDPRAAAFYDRVLTRALRTAGAEALAFASRICDVEGPRPLGSPACADVSRAVVEFLGRGDADGWSVVASERVVPATWVRGGTRLVLTAGDEVRPRVAAVSANAWSATVAAQALRFVAGPGPSDIDARPVDDDGPTVRSEVGPDAGTLPVIWPGRVPSVAGNAGEAGGLVDLVLSMPDALWIRRMLDSGREVRGLLDVEAAVQVPASAAADVVATISRAGPALRRPGCVVVLVRTDATDVGPAASGAAAVAVAATAARELVAVVERRPRRTIRFVFVAGPGTDAGRPQSALLERLPFLAEPDTVVLVLDARSGAGPILGIALEGERRWVSPMERAFAPLERTPWRVDDVGIRSVEGLHRQLRARTRDRESGPIPAFALLQGRTWTGVHGTRLDTPERLAEPDLAQAVAALVVVVRGLADDPEWP